MNEDFINKIYLQNCGDSLLVLEKSNIKDKSNTYYYRCQFQKYPFEGFYTKQNILKGTVLNPQIEQVEFIEKIWPQNCGDSLRILRKTEEKIYSNVLFECEFIKYPFKIKVTKKEIINGTVNNPEIENNEFIGHIFPQNCGDNLRVIKKTGNKKNTHYLYECEFIKYPYKVLVYKNQILAKTVLNPQIEQVEFINKIHLQNCGDSLKVLRKTKKLNYWECIFLSDNYKVKASKSNILKGNVNNPIFINIKNFPYKSKLSLIEFIKNNFKEKPTLKKLSNKLNISISLIGRVIHEFNLELYIKYCENFQENSLREFILQNSKDKIINNSYLKDKNKSYEIDILIPNLNLGFEYNGNLWHSNHPKFGLFTTNYHQEKSLIAKDNNIQLIHIFEYEWNNIETQQIIKSLIKSKLGIFEKRIYARQCEIKEINSDIYQKFCNENHLQKSAGARVKLGLFYKDELVQIMSFGVPRFTNKYEWEIIREASKLGYFIVGGKEKLWKYFLKKFNPNSILSYCDFSKFNGNSYLKLGFKLKQLNKPGFVWFDEKSKQIFLRSPNKHQEYKNKYLKIYDAGQLVFVWNK